MEDNNTFSFLMSELINLQVELDKMRDPNNISTLRNQLTDMVKEKELLIKAKENIENCKRNTSISVSLLNNIIIAIDDIGKSINKIKIEIWNIEDVNPKEYEPTNDLHQCPRCLMKTETSLCICSCGYHRCFSEKCFTFVRNKPYCEKHDVAELNCNPELIECGCPEPELSRLSRMIVEHKGFDKHGFVKGPFFLEEFIGFQMQLNTTINMLAAGY